MNAPGWQPGKISSISTTHAMCRFIEGFRPGQMAQKGIGPQHFFYRTFSIVEGRQLGQSSGNCIDGFPQLQIVRRMGGITLLRKWYPGMSVSAARCASHLLSLSKHKINTNYNAEHEPGAKGDVPRRDGLCHALSCSHFLLKQTERLGCIYLGYRVVSQRIWTP